MTLVVEENYVNGVPQTAVSGWAPPGAAWHWDANSLGGRAGWESTIRHLVNTRTTVNASYHGGFWHEHDTERTVLQWIVPTTKAAHSIAPSQVYQYNANKDRATQDVRFAEVRRILAGKASDPNAGCLAIAYSGMPAGLEQDLQCATFRADVQNLAQQLVGHPSAIDRPHFGHGWIQPITRYEMDVATDFIGLLYDELEGDDMGWIANIRVIDPVRVLLGAETSYRLRPDLSPESQPFVLGAESWRVMVGLVTGEDFGTGSEWGVLLSNNGATGEGGPRTFHTQDIKSRVPLLPVSTEMTQLQGALDSANKRTAKVKAYGADQFRKRAEADRDNAAIEEAAAKTIEGM